MAMPDTARRRRFVRPLTPPQLIGLVTLFLLVSANLRFFRELIAAFPMGGSNAGFLLSIPFVVVSLLVFLMALVSSRFTTRPLAALLLVAAAAVAYFSDRLGVVVDSTMVLNVLGTDLRETSELLSVELVARVLLLGLLPAVVMWRLPLHHRGWRVEALGKLRVMGIALAVILGLVVGLGSHYASFFREYKSIAPTEQTSVPLLLWVGENRDLDDDSILDGTKRATTHDTISPSLLTYFEIGTSALHEQTAAFALSPHAPRVAR